MYKILYKIPYFYDEDDQAYPIKYVNDLNCGSGALNIRYQDDSITPIDGDIVVEAVQDVHDILQGYPDVEILQNPYIKQ